MARPAVKETTKHHKLDPYNLHSRQIIETSASAAFRGVVSPYIAQDPKMGQNKVKEDQGNRQ